MDGWMDFSPPFSYRRTRGNKETNNEKKRPFAFGVEEESKDMCVC